jgi:hypothetical protein
MTDPTVTKVEAAVAASESPVLTFIKAHYAKVVYAIVGAAAIWIWKVL